MRRSRGVRGPNSALTEFLRNEGITDAFRQRQQQEQELRDTSETATPQSPLPLTTPPRSTPPATRTRRAARPARSTRTNAILVDDSSDDDEADPTVTVQDLSEDDQFRLSDGLEDEDEELPADTFGQEEVCAECGNPFTLSVYSRFVQDLKGYICEDCNEVLKQRERTAKRNQANARKRRKKLAKALLDKKTVRLASLQDVCIKAISGNIADVEALGDIGQLNINKILKILSKNRSLDDSTVTLFLNPDLKALELWDCSNVSSDSFNKIAAYCSRLEELTLFMCGQFHNDNLTYYIDKLPHLRKLSLNGPFLISDKVWQEFFDAAICPLEEFEVRNTHRFENNSLISLLEKRGKDLTLLKLSRLDGLNSAAVYELIPEYLAPAKLRTLEISHPMNASLISDDLLIHILAVAGENLRHLNVDGCSELTDAFLTEGVAKFCPNLQLLSMRHLNQVTNEGFANAFEEFAQINPGGLMNVDLLKATGLGDEAIYALLSHSGNTLVELSLNSLDSLSKNFFMEIMSSGKNEPEHENRNGNGIEDSNENGNGNSLGKLHKFGRLALPLLTKLDVGFVRQFDNQVLEAFSRECPKLTVLEVFGSNRCTSQATTRPDLLVIGRQGEDL